MPICLFLIIRALTQYPTQLQLLSTKNAMPVPMYC